MTIKEQLNDILSRRVLILDGAMGTMIQRRALEEKDFRGNRFADSKRELRGCNDVLSLTAPQVIAEIHEAYLAAGADMIETNTFNANAIRHFRETVDEYFQAGLSKEDIDVYAIGKKMSDAAERDGFNLKGDFGRLADRHVYADVSAFAKILIDSWLNREVDRIELVYNHYSSSASQYPVRETYLPFRNPSDEAQRKDGEEGQSYMNDYIIEPDAASVLKELLPKVLVLKIYTMLLDANAAEHAARTMAMQEATDNGNQLLQDLTLQFNKQRQQSITDELLDIVSGSLA